MRKTGTVLTISKGRAKVEIASTSLTCCSTGGSCADHGHDCGLVEMDAPEGLSSGDRVTVEFQSDPVVRNFLLFILAPAILLVGGVTAGYVLIPSASNQINMSAIVVGIGLMLGWYVAMHFIDKKRPPVPHTPPRIVGFGDGDMHPQHDH